MERILVDCGPRSMSHPQHVTLNMDTQLDRPTVSSTVGNVKPSAPSIRPQKKSAKKKHSAYHQRLQTRLPVVNEQWTRANSWYPDAQQYQYSTSNLCKWIGGYSTLFRGGIVMWKWYDAMGQVYVGAFGLHAELWNTQGQQRPTIEDYKWL